MQPVSLRQLIAATDGRASGLENLETPVQRIAIDSRRVRAGDVFWALKGTRHNGQNYVDQAWQNSAMAAIVEDASVVKPGRPAIIVEDTLLALWDFSHWYRQQFDALVIGVTGSVGKTTTRQMLNAALSTRFQGVQSPENYNNEFGVPLSLLEIEGDHEFAILELGASHEHEISDLARVALPEVGVITAIAPSHLEGFGSMEVIRRAKGELLEALPESGFAVLNGDDDNVRQLAPSAACRVIYVGEQPRNDLVAKWVRVENGWLRFRVDQSEFHVPVIGRHHLISAMVSVAIGREVDMTDEEIADGLRMFEAPPGRCQLQRFGPWTIIDDTYNANPASMAAACRTLRDWNTTHGKVIVLGDMLELGEQSRTYHEQLGALLAGMEFRHAIAVGPQAAAVAGSAKTAGMDAGCLGVCSDVQTARLLLDCWLQPGDVVLVKGSRGMKMEQVVEQLRQMAGSAITPQLGDDQRRVA